MLILKIPIMLIHLSLLLSTQVRLLARHAGIADLGLGWGVNRAVERAPASRSSPGIALGEPVLDDAACWAGAGLDGFFAPGSAASRAGLLGGFGRGGLAVAVGPE